MNDQEIRNQARNIINDSATASAIASGAFAQLAFFGADLALMLPVLVRMTVSIANLFSIDYSSPEMVGTLSNSLAIPCSLVLGSSVVNGFIGIVPLVGNLLSASITVNLIRRMGWAIYNALAAGEEITSLTKEDWKEYLERAKNEPT